MLLDFFERSGIGIDNQAHARVAAIAFDVGDLPHRVMGFAVGPQIDHHAIALSEQCLAVLFGQRVERSAIAREVRSESRDLASRLATIRAAKELAVAGVDLHSIFGSGRIKTDIPIG